MEESDSRRDRSVERRTVLALAGGSLTGLAGCSGLLSSDGDAPTDTASGPATQSMTATDTATGMRSGATTEAATDTATPGPETTPGAGEPQTERELASPDESSVATESVSNGEITLAVPVEATGGPGIYERLYREERLHATSMGPVYRDGSEKGFDSTAVTDYRALVGTAGIEVDHELSTPNSTATATVRIELPAGEPAAVVTIDLRNTGESSFTIDTPAHYIGTDVGLGQVKLWDYGPNYHHRAHGHDVKRYDEAGQWDTYSLSGDFAWISSFDDGRGITYGIDGAASDTGPNLAMTGSEPEKLRLFGTATTVAPGGTARIRTAIAAHHGGSGAGETGGEILASVLSV